MKSLHTLSGIVAIVASTLALVLSLASCGGDYGASAYPPADSNAPAEWSAIAVKAVLDASAVTPGGVSPMEESRAYAMAFVAAHDALNAIDRRYKPYLSDLQVRDASPDAAVASAVSMKARLSAKARPSQAQARSMCRQARRWPSRPAIHSRSALG